MKKLFLSFVAMMAATLSFAQTSLVATLSHGQNVTMYYGTYALRDAVNAAQSGDVINLSGGSFQSVDIKKGITLRGTGIDDSNPTVIINDFTINIPTTDANRVSMEGLRCTGHITMSGTFSNPYFQKSQFNEFEYSNDSKINNAMFANCKIIGNWFKLKGTSNIQFINCYVGGFDNWSPTSAGALFVNCIIYPRDGHSADCIRSSQLNNCIIYYIIASYGDQRISSTSTAINCIAINNNRNNTFDDLQSKAGCTNSDFKTIFKDFTGNYTDSQTFELTDDAKTKFLGIDGTQVGLYGGVLPYDSTPSYPQITKMNVANKTTADGKLSVEIEVNAAQ